MSEKLEFEHNAMVVFKHFHTAKDEGAASCRLFFSVENARVFFHRLKSHDAELYERFELPAVAEGAHSKCVWALADVRKKKH